MAVGIRRIYFNQSDVTATDTTPISTSIIIPIQPGQTLLFNGLLRGLSGNTTSAWGFYCTIPDPSTYSLMMTQIGTSDNGGTIDGQELNVNVVSGFFSAGISGSKLFQITGFLTADTNGGNFELFMAKSDANAGDFILQEHSFIEITVV